MGQAYDMELNQDQLEEMRRHFLGHVNGFKNFMECGEIYQTQERAYKDELATIFRREVMPLFKPFSAETSAGERDAEKAIQALHDLLANRVLQSGWGKPQNLSQGQPRFGAAPHAHLANIAGQQALLAATAFAQLLFGSEKSQVRLEKFFNAYREVFRRARVSQESEPGSLRTISTLVLMLAEPKRDLFVQYRPLNKSSLALTGRRLVSRGVPSAGEYAECLRFAHKLFNALSNWSPRDMIDVQSFIWVYYSYREPVQEENGGTSVEPYLAADVSNGSIDIAAVVAALRKKGIRLSERTVRRYHAALRARKFVILSGISGTGKTWLAELYAEVVGARKHIERVAPNWHSNEDLLGFVSPINNDYQDTEFSRFICNAAECWENDDKETEFHVILDEMNLARVEHYFSVFLSALEQRNRGDTAVIALGDDEIGLYPNLYFIGTVNMDETTHGFAPKVYDRAQLVPIDLDPDHFAEHVGDWEYGDLLIELRRVLEKAAPFAFRTVDDIRAYVTERMAVGASWEEAFDEAVLQKILPRISGMETHVGEALERVAELLGEAFPLSRAKAHEMLEGVPYGGASYF
jgi:AAA domain (dynein-related subfamily)